MVKVSVIVPVYNTAAFLGSCIESLIHQTLDDIEIIFINDASTDASLGILQEYKKKDPRISIICNNENMGEAASRNKGLAVATGKYIQFVDSDDYIDLDAVEVLYRMAESCNADMCYLGMQLHPEAGIKESELQPSIQRDYPNIYSGKELIKLFTENGEFFLYLCSVFYRTEFVRENNLSFKKLVVGLGGNFILRALCNARKVLVCAEKYYHYRVHGNSITHSENVKMELLLGQIVQYIDVLRYFSQDENAGELAFFLDSLYKKIAGGIQKLSLMEGKEIEARLGTDFSRHIFHMLLPNSKIYGIEFDKEILLKIQQKEFVIIYGAGYASKEIIELLQKHAIEIVGFAVTKRKNGQMNLYGHHVYEIQELAQYKNTAIVLVASNKKYNQDIAHILSQYGFHDVVFLNVEI